MSKITFAPNASGTGTLTVAAPNTNTNYTLTLPAETGTVLSSVSSITQNSGPAFSATNNATQTLSINTFTKILFQTENFDTNSNFASSTFTPTVAGYYFISASLYHNWLGSAGSVAGTIIYKNGSAYCSNTLRYGSNTGPWGGISTASVVYCNGSTDYVEVYAYTNNGSPQIEQTTNSNVTLFAGVLIRAA